MHLLGKYFKAYAITPVKDTIPLNRDQRLGLQLAGILSI